MRCTMPQQAQLVRQRLLLVLMATLLASLAVASTRDVATAAQPADHEPEPEPVPEPEPEPPSPPQPHPAPQPPPKPEPPLFWHGAKALTVPLLLGTLILLGHAPFLIRGCRRLARTIGTDRIGFYVSPVPPRTRSPPPTPPPTLSHTHTHTHKHSLTEPLFRSRGAWGSLPPHATTSLAALFAAARDVPRTSRSTPRPANGGSSWH